jgi:arabinogalactan endo-1,4-beta-galactosidase
MKKLLVTISALLLFISCSKDNENNTEPILEDTFIRGADMSYLPLIESEGIVYKHNNISQDALTTLKNAGCNTIRIRLWKNPTESNSNFTNVKAFAQRIRQAGMKVWLTVHYSDTWADPSNQEKPAEWQSLSFADLKTAVTNYTNQIMTEINPDIIQIGNETNDGILWPEGKLTTNENQFLELVSVASSSIRSKSSSTKIMLHYAGISGSDWFFNKVATIDYDYIGLSYYPIWHGKDLNELKNTINSLSITHNKKVVLAETAYPFTLSWNDWTNNIIGLENQLITTYPATPEGQKNYLNAIKSLVKQTSNGIGFCYWGSEWIAFRGNEATNGSTWENQALWDFNNNSLPVLEVFNHN